ncbi:MAG: rRNA methyltransferase [Bdellovibrionaceae bacterium]|nr:rRNA methyltransferase [Pseudobdellovibrionaceae bacterium]|tara:strand:+ start:1726 stop:2424 length:699 start_codon:yes stop_codon:yes gene_type:complete
MDPRHLDHLSESQKEALKNYLYDFLTDARKASIDRVLSERTRKLCVVLEDVYQGHNASAVMRSADAFGIQDLHTIESRNDYSIKKDIAMGTDKWITRTSYSNTKDCLKKLKGQGYLIVGTTPHPPTLSLPDFKMTQKTALIFGTELTGLSSEALDQCDVRLSIPMRGFAESFNISVSAALCMYTLSQLVRETPDWQLSPKDRRDLEILWAMRSASSGAPLTEAWIAKNVKKK